MEAFSVSPNSTKGVNSDASVTIRRKVCGRFIIRMMYRGFSTSLCSACGGNPIPEVQMAEDAVLYSEAPEKEKVGTARALFRALGFGRKKEPRPKAEKSKEVAKDKRRKPLFGPEESE